MHALSKNSRQGPANLDNHAKDCSDTSTPVDANHTMNKCSRIPSVYQRKLHSRNVFCLAGRRDQISHWIYDEFRKQVLVPQCACQMTKHTHAQIIHTKYKMVTGYLWHLVVSCVYTRVIMVPAKHHRFSFLDPTQQIYKAFLKTKSLIWRGGGRYLLHLFEKKTFCCH